MVDGLPNPVCIISFLKQLKDHCAGAHACKELCSTAGKVSNNCRCAEMSAWGIMWVCAAVKFNCQISLNFVLSTFHWTLGNSWPLFTIVTIYSQLSSYKHILISTWKEMREMIFKTCLIIRHNEAEPADLLRLLALHLKVEVVKDLRDVANGYV